MFDVIHALNSAANQAVRLIQAQMEEIKELELTIDRMAQDKSEEKEELELIFSGDGEIEHRLDRKFYEVELDAGETYIIECRGKGSKEGTLANPWVGVHDDGRDVGATGYILRDSDDNSGYVTNALLRYKPRKTGAHLIECRDAGGKYTGTYRVVVSRVL